MRLQRSLATVPVASGWKRPEDPRLFPLGYLHQESGPFGKCSESEVAGENGRSGKEGEKRLRREERVSFHRATQHSVGWCKTQKWSCSLESSAFYIMGVSSLFSLPFFMFMFFCFCGRTSHWQHLRRLRHKNNVLICPGEWTLRVTAAWELPDGILSDKSVKGRGECTRRKGGKLMNPDAGHRGAGRTT